MIERKDDKLSMTTVDKARDTAQDVDRSGRAPQSQAALASVITSATLFLVGKRDWSIFVGQWPPTFLLFGLFHKILRPSKF